MIMLFKKYEDKRKNMVADIMRKETFYSIRSIDVKRKFYSLCRSTYVAKIRVESEDGKSIKEIEIICTIYLKDKSYEIEVNK